MSTNKKINPFLISLLKNPKSTDLAKDYDKSLNFKYS